MFMDGTDTDRPFCRRYPAQLVNNQANDGVIRLQALYPVVNPDSDWCGEYKSK